MPTASSDGILFNTADGGGLGTLLAPDNLAKIQQLRQVNAFAGGVPTDASGNPDYSAAAMKLLKLGDYGNAGNLLNIGIQQQGISLAQRNAMGVGQAPGGMGGAPTGPGPVSMTGANPDVVAYIKAGAAARGISPNAALAVANSEGLRGFDPNGNPNLGDGGSSAGPFQLHYGNVAPGGNAVGGLGDDFTKATGLDARDPSTWKQQVDFSLDHAAKNGWSAWHGAKAAGIPAFAGIGGQPKGAQAAASSAQGGMGGPVRVAQNGTSDAPVSGVHPYAATNQVTPPQPGQAPQQPAAGSQGYAPLPAGASAPQAPTGRPAPMPTVPNAPPPLVDPSFAGQVPQAWLNAGHTAGEWVNYARQQAALNGAIPGGFGKAASEAWAKIADGVGSSIDKSMTFTNEQKNARDPQAVDYEHQRADYAAAARTNAKFTPQAIQGAGQLADAQATAKQNVENQNTLVPSVQPDGTTQMVTRAAALDAAQSGKPIASALPGYITSGQQNLLTKLNDGAAAYQERQVASERLDALAKLQESFQTGANSTAFNNAAAQLRSYGISVPNSATVNPAAMQQFTKNAYANVLSSMKEQGNKQYAAEVSSAVNSNPNPDLQPEANAAMEAQMKGIKQYHDQNFQDYANWYDGNKGAANDAQFQIGWAKQHPVQPFVDAARKEIAPLGVPIPPKAQLVDGQAYMVKGVKAKWDAGKNGFVPVGAN